MMLSQVRRKKTSHLESFRPLCATSPDGSDSSSTSFSSKVIKFKRSNRRRKTKITNNNNNSSIYNDYENNDHNGSTLNSFLGGEKSYKNKTSLKKSYLKKKSLETNNDKKYRSEKRAILGDISNQKKNDFRPNTFFHGDNDDEASMNTAVTSISDHVTDQDNRISIHEKKPFKTHPSATAGPQRKHTSQGTTKRRVSSHIYILLIGPQDRMFELLHMRYPSHFPKIKDIIPLISTNAAERKFQIQNHVGICKLYPNEKKHADSDMIESIHSIRSGDILVAVPKGYNHEYCRLIGQIIFKKNPHLDTWILNSTKKRPNKKNNNKLHHTQKADLNEISTNIPFQSVTPKAIDFEYDIATSPPSGNENDSMVTTKENKEEIFAEISTKMELSFDLLKQDNTDLSMKANETVSKGCDTEVDNLSVIRHREVVNPLKPTTSQNDFLAENLCSISRSIREKYGDKKSRLLHILAFLFTIQCTLYITSLFRVLHDNNEHDSEKPLDMDGLIRVILILFLLSKIQQNWETIKKYLVKTQRHKRRLVYSGNNISRQISRSSRAIRSRSRSLSSKNNLC